MKLRPTQSFNDSITKARDVFGTEGNNASSISRRALRAYSEGKFLPYVTHDKPTGNPISIKCHTLLSNKQFIAVVIGYVEWQIEKTMSRRQAPLNLDPCVNYTEDKAND